MKYSFKFKLFGNKVQMFSDGDMGIVIEKEPDVVCIYGTDQHHSSILCAIPLCHPKFLKGAEYVVDFCSDQRAEVSVRDIIKVVIDFKNHKCSNSKGARCYGSDAWGQDVETVWNEGS